MFKSITSYETAHQSNELLINGPGILSLVTLNVTIPIYIDGYMVYLGSNGSNGMIAGSSIIFKSSLRLTLQSLSSSYYNFINVALFD